MMGSVAIVANPRLNQPVEKRAVVRPRPTVPAAVASNFAATCSGAFSVRRFEAIANETSKAGRKCVNAQRKGNENRGRPLLVRHRA